MPERDSRAGSCIDSRPVARGGLTLALKGAVSAG
jgi:hypothetical protein